MVNRLRIEVASDVADRAAVLAASATFARARGIDETGVARIAAVLTTLLTWATGRAYPGGVGPIAVQLRVAEGGLEVLVSDRGYPGRDFGGAAGPVPTELESVSAVTRELRQINLAEHGTRLSAVITVAGLRPMEPPRAVAAPSPARVTPDEIRIRDGEPADAEAIVTLLFTCYGLSYGHPDFYRPSWVAGQMRAGRVLSTVAVFRGDVIGHHGLLVTESGGALESGVVVVHPAFRGLGIVSNHLAEVVARAESVAAPAIVSRAVTHHPYSQLTEQSVGFRTTGLMIGAAAYPGHPRSALTVAYLVLDERPHRVSLPRTYAAPLAAGYANARIAPAEPDVRAARRRLGDCPDVTVQRYGLAVMPGTEVVTICRWQERTPAMVGETLRKAIRSGVEVLYVDVDLEALTGSQLDAVVEMLRTHDFFYSALMLFGRHGHDHLRLQAMLTDEVQTAGLVLESDFARTLYREVMADVGPRLPKT